MSTTRGATAKPQSMTGTQARAMATTASKPSTTLRALTTRAQTHQTAALVSSSHSSHGGVSNEDLAGAIIGSILGTALSTKSVEGDPGARVELESKANVVIPRKKLPVQTPLPTNTTSFNIAAITPHPADDDTVRTRILTLFDQVSLHVDNYYTSSPTPAYRTDNDLAWLEKYNSGFLPAPISTMLNQKAIRLQVLTHTLVYTLLHGICRGNERQRYRLKPGELLPRVFAAQPNVDIKESSSDSALALKLFTWRMLTAHLTKRPKNQPRAYVSAAESLAMDFTRIFKPYSSPSYTAKERIAHLKTLANAASELGIWLFRQLCTFRFVWERSRSALSVTPSVPKIADENRRKLERWIELVEGMSVLYPAGAAASGTI
ncbi:hypothetical protein BDW74DRAFT_184303 [Aspergillus multicolor]|uniref:uncharacterized protein n=1 Tax=Aspergillus multicolor TaxID=41759 RepID=UPI003CCE04A9